MFMKAEKDRNVKSHSSTHGSTRVVPIDLGGRWTAAISEVNWTPPEALEATEFYSVQLEWAPWWFFRRGGLVGNDNQPGSVAIWESWETMKQSPAKWEDHDFCQFKNDSNHQKSLSLQQNEKLLMPLNWVIGATGYNQKGDQGPLEIRCHQWKCDPWVIRHIICPEGFVYAL